MADNNSPDITALTVQLVSAFVSNNSVASDDLAGLIKSTRAALTNELNPVIAAPETPAYTPAVSVRKSVSSPDHILSLIDGKPYKTLKRHLAANGLTADEYRARYKLPKSYPMVAASYSDTRRAVAAKIGLGRKPVTSAVPAAESRPAAAAAPSASAPAKAPSKSATPKNGSTAPASPAKIESVAKKAKAAPKSKSAATSKVVRPKAEKKPVKSAETIAPAVIGDAKPKAEAVLAKA
ncbi:MucR family transcriptional regulator [Sphingobium sp. 15-1]|uniref:MucR family transcriptional regulator n=1 Tax=Sphingobium sp. 15-1 TaxID=2729616 RepID=UPI00159C8247|nr:MucR family transcriptional regulator [Sphingobium sp. 15-1]